MGIAKADKKKCFIITPIGSEVDPIRRHIDGIIKAVINPVLGEDYEIVVAHEITKTGSINNQVIEHIYSSELVIANLTTVNPNVMYELAFRHALGKPVIQIMEKGTKIPFDIVDERTIAYENDAKGVMELQEEIRNFEKAIDYSKEMQGPIYSALRSIGVKKSVIASIDIGSSDAGDKDALEYIVNKLDDLEVAVSRRDRSTSIINNQNNYRPEVRFQLLNELSENDVNRFEDFMVGIENDYMGWKLKGFERKAILFSYSRIEEIMALQERLNYEEILFRKGKEIIEKILDILEINNRVI